jgi:hypothetical protein
MVKKPSHVKQLSLVQVCKIGSVARGKSSLYIYNSTAVPYGSVPRPTLVVLRLCEAAAPKGRRRGWPRLVPAHGVANSYQDSTADAGKIRQPWINR